MGLFMARWLDVILQKTIVINPFCGHDQLDSFLTKRFSLPVANRVTASRSNNQEVKDRMSISCKEGSINNYFIAYPLHLGGNPLQ